MISLMWSFESSCKLSGVCLKSKIVLKYCTLQFFFQTYLVLEHFLTVLMSDRMLVYQRDSVSNSEAVFALFPPPLSTQQCL